jgi:hypothetical protein
VPTEASDYQPADATPESHRSFENVGPIRFGRLVA